MKGTTTITKIDRRRKLELALGLLWLVDGCLQLQPYMLGPAFADHVLEPAAAENPSWVGGPILFFAHLIKGAPVPSDLAFAAIQLGIGIALLRGGNTRPALLASTVWAGIVWYLGEGLGGVLGAASPLTGAPGAAVLYAFLSLLAWPRDTHRPSEAAEHLAAAADGERRRVGRSERGRLGRLAIGGWLALWGSLAWFAAGTGFAGLGVAQAGIFEGAREAVHAPALAGWVGQVADTVARASGEPGWLAGLDRSWAVLSADDAAAIAVAFTVVFALVAVAPLAPRAARRPLLLLGLVAAVALWIVGENFGEILTGHATDPNTGPLLIATVIAFWPPAGRRTSAAPLPAASQDQVELDRPRPDRAHGRLADLPKHRPMGRRPSLPVVLRELRRTSRQPPRAAAVLFSGPAAGAVADGSPAPQAATVPDRPVSTLPRLTERREG